LQPFLFFWRYNVVVIHAPLPIAILEIKSGPGKDAEDRSEPVYGGYANPRGEIVLFAKDAAFGVNFKSQTLARRPPLNAGAQARYDAAEAGEHFQFANKTFRRLSHEQIVGICASHSFRITNTSLRS
jgi:hypothetical protein